MIHITVTNTPTTQKIEIKGHSDKGKEPCARVTSAFEMLANLLFLYSHDLSNSKTNVEKYNDEQAFLYSQDLSNSKTFNSSIVPSTVFLYSQDLSNSKTFFLQTTFPIWFLYSQDLSNSKT